MTTSNCLEQTVIPRKETRSIFVGEVEVGGDAPVSVQSMCSTPTEDTEATLTQIKRLAEAGCEIIRVAIPAKTALDSFSDICKNSPIPVVADIHFDYRLALEACARGASALRINPGNIGSFDKVDQVIDAAAEAKIPIRIGVNAGSLETSIDTRQDLDLPSKLVLSSKLFVEHFEQRGFFDIALSAKAHDVQTTLATYRQLSQELPEIPLHIGVTEAGTLMQGTVKSSVGLGILLSEGIGNTMRVSLTADPVEEVRVGWNILASLGIRRQGPEIVSCPTCGRCRVDLISLANEVQERLSDSKAPLSVAVMGCAVNGPGEARGCDIGVACGNGQGVIFKRGEVIRKAREDEIVDILLEEISHYEDRE